MFGSKHTERVGKTKDLCKALKALSLTQKSGGFIISALDLEHNTQYQINFKDFLKFLVKPLRNLDDKTSKADKLISSLILMKTCNIWKFKLLPTAEDTL